MPLSTAQVTLEAQILAAFKKAQLAKNPQSATAQLASDLAQAIYVFTVQTTVNPGQAVIVGTPSGPGAGSTTSTGTVS
jgi:2-keto-4-pentenoate hydratase/2-oxohepta-3-ene-1,7-dioic acid hydratase in catechol pathway